LRDLSAGLEAAARVTVPAMLPPGPRWFTGRKVELAVLDGLLGAAGGPVVAAVTGTAGAGKTVLALHRGNGRWLAGPPS